MEPLTTYRAKGKEIGLVFLFKYDLNGDLRLFEITEGILNSQQINWLYSERFPANENIITSVWMKKENYLKHFEIEKSPADLSFESLWDLYGYKESRKDAENQFKKLKEQEKIKCFIQVPKYKKNIAQRGIAQALLSTWLNKQRYNDEYADPVVNIKNPKNFNPALQNLAKLKTVK